MNCLDAPLEEMANRFKQQIITLENGNRLNLENKDAELRDSKQRASSSRAKFERADRKCIALDQRLRRRKEHLLSNTEELENLRGFGAKERR